MSANVDAVKMETSKDARLVHLDLKGAPPKLSYYEKIFPLIRRWGGNGLLVEYEDMFPYHGELATLAAPNAYSFEDVRKFLQLAKDNQLTVIPLVQTFGHMEFVLKFPKYKELREVKDFPMALCPSHQASAPLAAHMVEQVIELHPEIQWFHIGADEVFHLGICEECQRQMKVNNWTPTHLFFSHVREVIGLLRTKHPHLKFIMWDDMFRETDVKMLLESGLGNLVEPMVWYYQKTFQLPTDIWDRYSQVFPLVWAASAFKGATGPCQSVTDVSYHVENHKGWLDVVSRERAKFKVFRGYAVTGWQRYDHFSVLCELLPASLPSLAVCLLTLANGSFTESVHRTASTELGFSDLIPLNPFESLGNIPSCSFPGSEVYRGTLILLCHAEQLKLMMENDRLNGWMTDYHMQQKFCNPAHIHHFLPHVEQLLHDLKQLRTDLELILRDILFADAVDEWLRVNIDPRVTSVSAVHEKASTLLTLGARPKEIDNRLTENRPDRTT